MSKATNLKEAEKFFLENSSGYCLCVNEHKKKIVKSYPEAVEFYKIKSKKMY